ncbi:NAD(P)/FAD-dependent oxidoreductase [Lactiplantibacillus fabifermentans]|uniref:Nadh dehydrogenase n=2 Tax=Lactiplantibacillus fabifermentans TaxID=483011 RepID=A0A0R2NIL4_9LACO|nr:NAD(P)/FAD-dependent oxidoreductase [Lactiplantibacillus fabifermentans]ETY75462.1 NADH dehydrogenase [Lactiplantibacillus fabifermentans T30PCM01]KRO24706.1 nadh dehydrogenase [Lactiplantibacillus fabifermentans DSM 21115]
MAKTLVLGGGYAGMRAIKFLQKTLPKEDQLILVDQTGTHTEKTNLHEVAAGTIAPDRITYDIKTVISSRVDFIQATVNHVDVETKTVSFEDHADIEYDYLVLALGFQSETFGVAGADENALPMDDLATSQAVYAHIEDRVRAYAESNDHNDLKIAVCGAGFTGIELLGELTQSLPKLSAKYQTPAIKLVCLERMPSILPMFNQDLRDYALKFMADHDVEMRLGASIEAIKPGAVVYSDADKNEHEFTANTIIWTVGVSGSHVIADSGFEQRRNRVVVKPDLSLADHPEVFIIGDVSAVMDPSSNRPYPTTAQIALACGEQAAKNIGALRAGQATTPFVYHSSGTVASLSDRDGIGEIFSNNRPVKGYPASALKKIITDRSLMESAHLSTVFSKGRFDLYH